MKVITVNEAKTLYCPATFAAGVDQYTACISGDCMAWQWIHHGNKEIPDGLGYCRMYGNEGETS